MAFRKPERLVCPGCGREGEAVFLVGIGPETAPGEGPSSLRLLDGGGWTVEEIAAGPFFAGRIVCPDCGAEVLNRPAGHK